MAQSLYTLENIYFVAGRDYILDGKQIHAGDVVENARELRNVESFVRSRHLIPVVKNHNDVPVYFQKDVKVGSLVEEKFNLTIKWPAEDNDDEVAEYEDEVFDPSEHTIPEVLEYVEEHPEETEEILEAEIDGKDRVTLEDTLLEKLYDPSDYTIPQVVEYVEEHPDQRDAVIESEKQGKNRPRLLSQLEQGEDDES